MKRFLNIAIILLAMTLPLSCIAQSKSTKTSIEEEKENVSMLIQTVDSLYKVNAELVNLQAANSEPDVNIVAIVGTICVFGGGALVIILSVFFICNFKFRQRSARYRVIEKALDHNVAIPESFFENETPAKKSRLQSALVWMAWGLGLMLFFFLVGDGEGEVALGCIPLFVGIAKLITYFVEDHKKA